MTPAEPTPEDLAVTAPVADLLAAVDRVYAAGPSRLVLPAGAHHFRQLRTCAICGKEMTGRPVIQPAGLEPSAEPHMCQACSTGATGIL